MWQDFQDSDEMGVPVRLYQPILYSGRSGAADPTFSHVGGFPSYFPTDTFVNTETPQCGSCKHDMYLLLQLYNPDSERTLYVFGCNEGWCVASALEGSNPFSLGGGGRFVCRRSKPGLETCQSVVDQVEIDSPVVDSPWGSDGKGDAGNDDWDLTDGDVNIKDVETMLEAMEMEESKTKTEKRNYTKKTSMKASSSGAPSFPSFEIHGLQEPTARKSEDMDEDDVGTMGESDAKIQEMLARYMEEEVDEDIIAAIQGSVTVGGGRGEKDEQLPPEDRVMLAFTDRVKRAPRQIVRYAQGGIPLWSVPLIKETTPKAAKKPDHEGHDNTNTLQTEMTFQVPNCSCGAPRQFVCQLMPNLLGVLDVDKHSRSKSKKSTAYLSIDELMSREHGGMNWGVIAIYTCKENCDDCREDYVIVQDSVDGNPEKRAGPTDDAMVMDVDKGVEKCYIDFDDADGDCEEDSM